MNTVGFAKHNHATCIKDGMKTVDAHCAESGLQLTPVRRRVLEILLAQHRALGAYEILDVLRAEGLGSQPPVVYRALDFLSANGFVHKIERLNAFVACVHPHGDHTPVFLICHACDSIAEAHTEHTDLTGLANDVGFQIERTIVEAEGLCPKCQKNPHAA